MKYKWKYGCTQAPGISAQMVGEELEKLEHDNEGTLLPSTVVRAARPKKSKLHKCFEWDDNIAGEKYREHQARDLLRKIVVLYEKGKKKDGIRAFVNIRHGDETYYVHTKRVVVDQELQENILREIQAALLAIKKKYAQFKSPALQEIWDAIDTFVEVG